MSQSPTDCPSLLDVIPLSLTLTDICMPWVSHTVLHFWMSHVVPDTDWFDYLLTGRPMNFLHPTRRGLV